MNGGFVCNPPLAPLAAGTQQQKKLAHHHTPTPRELAARGQQSGGDTRKRSISLTDEAGFVAKRRASGPGAMGLNDGTRSAEAWPRHQSVSDSAATPTRDRERGAEPPQRRAPEPRGGTE
ncbi:MAG: hypothetical protein ACLPXT_00390 [Terracidiphilus sp.]